MLRRTLPPLTRNKPCILPSRLHCHRTLSTSPYLRQGDPLPSVFEGVSAPLEVTTVLRTGKGFKIRTIQDPENPRTIHGNLFILHGDYFLWRPTLQFTSPNTLDIAPESWNILDVITPKPELLVLGTGNNILFVQRAREALGKMGIQLDIQSTRNASSMFNLLSTEGRNVAAALLVQDTLNQLQPKSKS